MHLLRIGRRAVQVTSRPGHHIIAQFNHIGVVLRAHPAPSERLGILARPSKIFQKDIPAWAGTQIAGLLQILLFCEQVRRAILALHRGRNGYPQNPQQRRRHILAGDAGAAPAFFIAGNAHNKRNANRFLIPDVLSNEAMRTHHVSMVRREHDYCVIV